jgi:hypothetical protein
MSVRGAFLHVPLEHFLSTLEGGPLAAGVLRDAGLNAALTGRASGRR